MPVWTGVLALLGALFFGAGAGVLLRGGSDSGSDHSPVRSGVVDRLDTDGSNACIGDSEASELVECYLVPGGGLSIGDRIRYRIEQEPIDPDEPGKGTQPVLVYVAAD